MTGVQTCALPILATAYENTQQQEICGATENIVRREKELCELALGDLKRLSEGKGESDETLKLIMDHYRARLETAREKEEKINLLSEDSRKMMEEYKKKTQELADVKRTLMESQTRLRELAKSTEKLLKKEEELRFIENNLRTELDKNKRNIINGLYEVVADFSEHSPEAHAFQPQQGEARTGSGTVIALREPDPVVNAPSAPEQVFAPQASDSEGQSIVAEEAPTRMFSAGLFQADIETQGEGNSQPPRENPPAQVESLWNRDKAYAGGWSPGNPSAVTPAKSGSLLDRSQKLKLFEPGRNVCSKSTVKTQEGEVISEYFYSPMQAKDARHYLFNSLFAISSLLALKAKDEDLFQERLETVFSDLLSRLEHSHNIHLETFLRVELNREVLSDLLAASRESRWERFETISARVLARLENLGGARSGLIERQFRDLPRPAFPPGMGLAA